MKKLILMRHGEAEGSPDRHRILTQQGIEQCKTVAAYFRHENIIPDYILCSGILRAKQTLENLDLKTGRAEYCGDSLYTARSGADIINLIEDELVTSASHAECILVIGHNPTIHEAVLHLARNSDIRGYAGISMTYPPATASIFNYRETVNNAIVGKIVLPS